MKRRWIAIVMLMVISSDLMANTIAFGNYLYKYNKYLELCENKDNLEMHCNGNCQLAKQLNIKDNDNDAERSEPTLSINQWVLFSEDPVEYHITSNASDAVFTPSPEILEGVNSPTFHPPM